MPKSPESGKRVWVTKSLSALMWLLCLCSIVVYGATNAPSAKSLPKASTTPGWDEFNQPGSFITALALDRDENIWVGTEGNGVFRYKPREIPARQWSQFTTTNGLGDNYAYSLVCDQKGRIWAGHLNHGVSVFNGAGWTNYDIPDGPIGERVFKMAVCPTDGDVWIGTSAGLTRYLQANDSWRHYTRADGLPSDQVSALAFDAKGNLYLGTLCDGVAFARAESGYTNWQRVPVLDKLQPIYAGFGFPSPQINDLLVAYDGVVFAATSCGLAYSADQGANWTFKRGREYIEKDRWKSGIPPKPPPGSKVKPKDKTGPKDIMAEDYVTCLAEDDTGLIWIGFRQQGFLAIDSYARRQIFSGAPKQLGGADWVYAILPTPEFKVFLGRYGGSLMRSQTIFKRRTLAMRVSSSTVSASAVTATASAEPLLTLPESAEPVDFAKLGIVEAIEMSPGGEQTTDRDVSLETELPTLPSMGEEEQGMAFAEFPSPARAPSLKELNGMLQELAAVPPVPASNQPVVLALEDDWRTQGQWTGRYGRFWTVLCANWSPLDDVWGAGWDVMYHARIGPNHRPGDSLRYWVHWLATKDNRCLEMSPTYLHSRVVKNLTTWEVDRRESEWDDHGETYPMIMNGPHLYCSLTIPPGLFYLSLYDINPNGHNSLNRFRDYYVSVKPHPGRTSLDESGPGWKRLRSFYDLQEFDQKEEWAHARFKDFWGGVYKRFLVRGPTKLTFQMNRNYSFNTILAGVMLDLVDELPPPYHRTREDWEQEQRTRKQQWPVLAGRWEEDADGIKAATTPDEAVQRVFAALRQARDLNVPWWAANKRRFYQALLRWCLETDAVDPGAKPELYALAGTCAYELQLFPQWEGCLRAQGKTPAREIERALRWDGVTWSCAGQGNKIVRDYLAEQVARTNKLALAEPAK